MNRIKNVSAHMCSFNFGKKTSTIWCFFAAIALAVSCVAIIAINFLNTPYSDDWCTPLRTFNEIFSFPINLYFTWSGRLFSSFLLAISKYITDFNFAIINIVFTVALCHYIVKLAVDLPFGKKYLLCCTIAYVLIWFQGPSFGETMVWKTGSVVYLWTGVAMLAWLLPYKRLLFEGAEGKKWPWQKSVIFVLFSLCVGNSIENTSFCVFLMSLAVVVWVRKRDGAIPAWAYLGLIACLAGWVLLMVAPGNFMRADNFKPLTFYRLWKTCKSLCSFWSGQPLFYIAILLLVHFFSLYISRSHLLRNFTLEKKLGFWLLLFAFINTAALAVSPTIPARVQFGTFIIMITGIIASMKSIVGDIDTKSLYDSFVSWSGYSIKAIRVLSILLCTVFLVVYTVSVKRTVRSYKYSFRNHSVFMKELAEQKNSGQKIIFLPDLKYKQDKRQYRSASGLEEPWVNACFSQYYRVDSVKILDDTQ